MVIILRDAQTEKLPDQSKAESVVKRVKDSMPKAWVEQTCVGIGVCCEQDEVRLRVADQAGCCGWELLH